MDVMDSICQGRKLMMKLCMPLWANEYLKKGGAVCKQTGLFQISVYKLPPYVGFCGELAVAMVLRMVRSDLSIDCVRWKLV